MKKFFIIFLMLNIFCIAYSESEQSSDKQIRVLTFNIRNNKSSDGADRWSIRKPLTVNAIVEINPDIFGIQEAYHSQVRYLAKNFPEYEYVGEGRQGGIWGEHCSIFYKKSKFSLISTQTRWLSDTPDVKSISWGNTIYRVITIATLKSTEGDEFSVINAHFDHQSENSRLRSAMMVSEIVNASALPVIVIGDLNATPDSEPIKFLLEKSERSNPLLDAFYFTGVESPDCSANGTFHGFKGITNFPRIDYVMFTRHFAAKNPKVWRESYNLRFPSDHYPVFADLAFVED
ncbi:MAG: endonuclease/exonuclease/phosphatase family protein [Spirochaetales bacterium]|nr:endonuclease/exonuclease/phosphatase family protein [Spirochaetales bacterium]